MKELRKYYVPERTAVSYLNRVTFLVNIKPEAELAAVLQDAASISEAFERGTRFALDYCLKIRGFRDLEAADTLVELVSMHLDLLASEELYEYTHGRLVNGTLKKKYTNRRK